MTYYPEMNEKPEPRLFRSRNSYASGAILMWAPEANDEALRTFRALRIRPQRVQFDRVGIELTKDAKANRWSATITHKAFRKLADADLVAHEMLLD